jgi:Anti-sigma-K factor rskA, C-terminal
MNCHELREHYDLYALDIAEEPERSEIRAHLTRGCEVCMAGVRHSLETAALIGSSAPLAQPSPQLRSRILASVGSGPGRPSWFALWATAAAAAVLLALLIFVGRDRERYVDEAAGARAALSILYAPGTIEASFGGGQPQPPRGAVFVNPSQGVLLLASNLFPAPAHKIYEMWLIPKGAKPVPAGLFQSHRDGEALHLRRGTVDVAATAAVAVTVEDEAGAAQPTTTPFIVVPLASAAR